MADASVERNGAKWLLAVLLVVAVFGVLFVVGYSTNMWKRNYPDNSARPSNVTSDNR